jgi:hypothetical protein
VNAATQPRLIAVDEVGTKLVPHVHRGITLSLLGGISIPKRNLRSAPSCGQMMTFLRGNR